MDAYDCPTHTLYMQRYERKCGTHHISTKNLRAIVLEVIRLTADYAIKNEEEFIRRVREASRVRKSDEAAVLRKKLARDEKRHKQLDNLIKKLYESYARGKITESRFDLLLSEYETEQKELAEVIEKAREEKQEYDADTDRADQFLALAKKYRELPELTTPMLYEFVEKIIVHAPQRIDDERTQEVEVYLKYIGNFDVPLPPPTEEEIQREVEREKRHAAYRKKYLRKKERDRIKREAAEKEAAKIKKE